MQQALDPWLVGLGTRGKSLCEEGHLSTGEGYPSTRASRSDANPTDQPLDERGMECERYCRADVLGKTRPEDQKKKRKFCGNKLK